VYAHLPEGSAISSFFLVPRIHNSNPIEPSIPLPNIFIAFNNYNDFDIKAAGAYLNFRYRLSTLIDEITV
jgi:hypothetical protein